MADNPKNRITVVESIYHTEFGQNPSMIDARYSRELDSDEQLYQRRLTATEEWSRLDTGWIEEAGLMVIKNLTGEFLQISPSEEEKEETKKKILELSYLVGANPFDSLSEGLNWLIPPKETMKAVPSSVKTLFIRSQFGEIKYNLYLFPK